LATISFIRVCGHERGRRPTLHWVGFLVLPGQSQDQAVLEAVAHDLEGDRETAGADLKSRVLEVTGRTRGRWCISEEMGRQGGGDRCSQYTGRLAAVVKVGVELAGLVGVFQGRSIDVCAVRALRRSE
jgi:hypothetical protein